MAESEQRSGSFFPHLVVRLAGLSVDTLDGLNATRSVHAADALIETRSRLQADAESLSAALFERVPGEPKPTRRRLLRLRRDLYNLREPRAQDMDVLTGTEVVRRVRGFVEDLRGLDEAHEAYRRTFAEEASELQAHLLECTQDHDFRAGLRLSSRALSEQLDRIDEGPGASLDTKTERGLLRYLTRAAAKATPFGRFCAIAPGAMAPGTRPLSLDGDPTKKWSRIRVNKRLMRVVLGHLVADEDSRHQLPLRLNPTAQVEDEVLRFLAAFSGREAFQLVARNAAVDLVVEQLRQREGATIRAMAAAISALDDVDATAAEAEAYLDQFFEIGLLQPDLPGLGHDPDWPRRLAAILEDVDDGGLARKVRIFLLEVDRATAALRDGSTQGVDGPQLAALESLIERTLEEGFDETARAPRPTVYEDAATAGTVVADTAHFSRALRHLSELFATLVPVVWSRREGFAMRRFFERHHGEERVPLLTFYEHYYREHVKPAEEAKKPGAGQDDSPRPAEASDEGETGPSADHDGTPDSGEDPASGEAPPTRDPDASADPEDEPSASRAIRLAHRRLADLLRSRWHDAPHAREVVLTAAELGDAVGEVPALPAEPRSLSAFVNFVPRAQSSAGGLLVLPHARAFAGYGKYFSRFLYLLPDAVLEDLREAAGATSDVILAELAGDAAFNANLRPPIQRTEIVYPTGDRIGCPEALEVRELEVGPSVCGTRLDLFHRESGRRVLPLDLGFLNPLARPPLYRLLRSLSPIASSYLALPTSPTQPDRAGSPAPRQVVHRPRLTYEDAVVLAREAWFVPVETLPAPEPEEPEPEGLLRWRRWQGEVGLPERVYVRVVRGPGLRTTEAKAGPQDEATGSRTSQPNADQRPRRRVGDLAKPQVMDFRSPALLRLLDRYRTLGAPWMASFEECLPGGGELLVDPSGRRWVSEAIVQVEMSGQGPVVADPVDLPEVAYA